MMVVMLGVHHPMRGWSCHDSGDARRPSPDERVILSSGAGRSPEVDCTDEGAEEVQRREIEAVLAQVITT